MAMTDLPELVLLLVVESLAYCPRALARLPAVCKTTRQVMRDEELWRRIVVTRYGSSRAKGGSAQDVPVVPEGESGGDHGSYPDHVGFDYDESSDYYEYEDEEGLREHEWEQEDVQDEEEDAEVTEDEDEDEEGDRDDGEDEDEDDEDEAQEAQEADPECSTVAEPVLNFLPFLLGECTSQNYWQQLYFHLGRTRVRARDMFVVWLNGQYLNYQQDPTSVSGEVVVLNGVFWLHLEGVFPGVLPGRYRVVWRMKRRANFTLSQPLVVTALWAPAECGPSPMEKYSKGDHRWPEGEVKQLLRGDHHFAENSSFADCLWGDLTCGVVTVPDNGTVKVTLYSYTYHKAGMAWDYVELVPLFEVY